MVASEQPAETEETKPPHLTPINGKDRPPKEKMELTSRVAITRERHPKKVKKEKEKKKRMSREKEHGSSSRHSPGSPILQSKSTPSTLADIYQSVFIDFLSFIFCNLPCIRMNLLHR